MGEGGINLRPYLMKPWVGWKMSLDMEHSECHSISVRLNCILKVRYGPMALFGTLFSPYRVVYSMVQKIRGASKVFKDSKRYGKFWKILSAYLLLTLLFQGCQKQIDIGGTEKSAGGLGAL